MYAYLWNHLPGPTPVRVLTAFALIFGIVSVLFLWVFPWLEPRLPFTDVTVNSLEALSTGLSTGWG
jgi:hypothetical protein